MKSDRGCLTDEIKEKAEKYLGREFTVKELRLYPYIQYCVMNGGYIDRVKTSSAERDILQKLVDEKHLKRGYQDVKRGYPDDFYPTREFWMFLNDIMADTYVVLAEDIEGDEE